MPLLCPPDCCLSAAAAALRVRGEAFFLLFLARLFLGDALSFRFRLGFLFGDLQAFLGKRLLKLRGIQMILLQIRFDLVKRFCRLVKAAVFEIGIFQHCTLSFERRV